MEGHGKEVNIKTITLVISTFAGNNSILQGFGTVIVIREGGTKAKK
jgi:putative heme iron utilization protein